MDIDDDLKHLLDQLSDDDPNQTDNILPIDEPPPESGPPTDR